MKATDIVALNDLRVECIIGVYPHERIHPQWLVMEIELAIDTRSVYAGAGLAGTVDYARLAGELRFILEASRFRMLEQAAEAVARYVLAPPPPDTPRASVAWTRIHLQKPGALRGLAVPRVTIQRHAEEYEFPVEELPFGSVTTLFTKPELGIYRIQISPHSGIPTHLHREMDEEELMLGTGLFLQGRPLQRGTAVRWPKEFPHRYENPHDRERSLLRVNRPRFLPEDQVEVQADLLKMPEIRSYYPVGDAD